MNYSNALALVLKHEGGLVDHPEDPGGLSKYGISKRAYPDIDIAALTEEAAGKIYFQDYWVPLNAEELPPPVALMVFDTAVNMGVRRAARFAQRAAGVVADGNIGPISTKAINNKYEEDPEAFLKVLHGVRQNFYEKLKTFPTFGRGWTRRNTETLQEAIKWAKTS